MWTNQQYLTERGEDGLHSVASALSIAKIVCTLNGLASNERGLMGGMLFDPQVLADSLAETVGYKAGLTLSITEMCDHLSGTQYPEIIRASEANIVRLRAEEYDEVFYKLLHRVGYTQEEFNGDTAGLGLYHLSVTHILRDFR